MTLELYLGHSLLSSPSDLLNPNAKGYPSSYNILVYYACYYYNSSPKPTQKAPIYPYSYINGYIL